MAQPNIQQSVNQGPGPTSVPPQKSFATVPLKIRVVEGPDEGHSHGLYEVQLSLPHGQTWVTERRYSEFLALKNDLDPFLTDSEKALFPPKHPLSSSKDPAVVQVRWDSARAEDSLWRIRLGLH